MKELTLNTLGGFMNNMLLPNLNFLEHSDITIDKEFWDINTLFWKEILEFKSVLNLIKDAKKLDIKSNYIIQIKALLNNQNLFMKYFKEAKANILHDNLTEQTLFSYLETLQIVCELYSEVQTNPFRLCIDKGFVINNYSSYEMLKNSLLLYCNPYLDFIQRKIIPELIKVQPRLLFLAGRPNIATFAIARLIRNNIPNIFIVISDNSSEYYSLNKINNLLVKNKTFFSVFDCVILENNIEIKKKIKNAIHKNQSLNNINSIIYTTNHGKNIINTICQNKDSIVKYINQNNIISGSIDIKLFPNNRCYWNKCTFCAINKKYLNDSQKKWYIDEALNTLKLLNNKNIKYFWAIDEAIPPDILFHLSQSIIKENLNFTWHVRSRIDKQLLEKNVIDTMKEAGVKSVILGFESGNKRILNLMNKTNIINDYLFVAEKIVERFNSVSIQIHFPIIIGFPTETSDERKETFDFLDYLKNNYENFSYNVNIFCLDITSDINSRWYEFDISEVHFPCAPQYFIGNLLSWNSSIVPFDGNNLENEREEQMLKQYDWYPKSALLSSNLFFIAWENRRLTLFNEKISKTKNIPDKFTKIKLNQMTIIFQIENHLWCMYQFYNHHNIIGGDIIKEIEKISISGEIIENLLLKFPEYMYEKILQLAIDLAKMELIILI